MSLITLILTSVNIINYICEICSFVLSCPILEKDNFIDILLYCIVFFNLYCFDSFFQLSIVRQRDKLEPWFNHFLVEDKGLNGSASYVDFLCHIHKEIRNILS